ncbi:TatD family hydrolase [Amphritea balenae]|uniref:TatD family deoxyribonuclease n=1 Tax=Amphritea balenae TaxID=452629 RepID=A0A3P1SNN8_9GAMM|nr:TatD family hydrolase [Amphritea balenae]RRC98629.1 TatD family deoxyribonuclease [Amphritea balenae]GGK66098.1 metal-dependent hydrolase [Amphritea balenae]
MRLIDTHVHLDFPQLADEIDAVLSRARDKGVSDFVVPGVELDNWQAVLDLCAAHSGLYPALGLHPCFSHSDPCRALLQLEAGLKNQNLVAVGEIGLDLFIPDANLDQQLKILVPQLELAKRFEKPVLLHVRKAHDQMLKQLRQLRLEPAGIVHAFSGSEQQAREYLKLGFKLGVGGTVTYDRASKLRAIVATLPLESFVLETDAPDMPLLGYQGQVNYPERVVNIARKVAELRQLSSVEVARVTSATSQRLLCI